MKSRFALRLTVTLACAGLLLGAQSEGCTPSPSADPPPNCELACEHGFKSDTDGTLYCECRDSHYCIALAAEPHRDPATGDCVDFATVCDVPDGWASCGPGCVVDGIFYDIGDSIPAAGVCVAACVCTELGVQCEAAVGCGPDPCAELGELACLEDSSCEPLYDWEQCWFDTAPAGGARDLPDCLAPFLSCIAYGQSDRGMCESTGGFWDAWACGDAFCGVHADCWAMIPGCDCGPDANFVDGIGCVPDAECAPCDYNGTSYAIGSWFPATDGCNTCQCTGAGVSCTEMACVDCSTLDQATCNIASGCGWYSPGCGEPALSVAGCYDDVGCMTGIGCSPGTVCQAVWTNPCGGVDPACPGCDVCAACGTETYLCVPGISCDYLGATYLIGDTFPAGDGCNSCTCTDQGIICTEVYCQGCWGAWLDETNTCRAPNDGAYPDACCSDLTLCTSTGGTWHTGGCGHWPCGQEIFCGMIDTPGCDCGPDANFDAALGCVVDASCNPAP